MSTTTHSPAPPQPAPRPNKHDKAGPAPRLKKDAGPAPAIKRVPGAQFGNTNARKHGLYASRDPHPAAALIKQASHITDLGRQAPQTIPVQVEALRHIALQIIDQVHLYYGRAQLLTPAELALLYQLFRVFDKILSLVRLQYSLGAEMRLLQSLAVNAACLTTWEFESLDIPTHPVFVPHSFENLSHLSTFCRGLDPSGAFLTDRHWFIIQPILESLRDEQVEWARVTGRRRPSRSIPVGRRSPYPDRFVLDGILWKLATACRWDQLPPEYPVRRCQRLYRQLYKTGRMAAIYQILHQDLYGYGQATLEALVEGGEYRFHASKIIYIPKNAPDWEHIVALLLLQRAYFNHRKRVRENQAERCRQGRTFRLPPLRPLPSMRPRAYKKRPPQLLPRGTFIVPPAHAHPLLRRPRILPLEVSPAWARWAALQKLDRLLREQLEDP